MNEYEYYDPSEETGVECLECGSHFHPDYSCSVCKVSDFLVNLSVEEIFEVKRQIGEY